MAETRHREDDEGARDADAREDQARSNKERFAYVRRQSGGVRTPSEEADGKGRMWTLPWDTDAARRGFPRAYGHARKQWGPGGREGEIEGINNADQGVSQASVKRGA